MGYEIDINYIRTKVVLSMLSKDYGNICPTCDCILGVEKLVHQLVTVLQIYPPDLQFCDLIHQYTYELYIY